MNRVAEQRRRDALKSSLKDLRSLIPGAIDAAVDKDATVNGQGQTKSAIIRQSMTCAASSSPDMRVCWYT